MDAKLAMELLMKSAGKMPTYPISRALTHPATTTLGGLAAGSAAEGLATGENTGLGALAGGALGYLSNKIQRFIHARGLVSRGVSLPEALMEGEWSAIRKAIGKKEAAEKSVSAPYPWSQILTSRAFGGASHAMSAVRGAAHAGEDAAGVAGAGAVGLMAGAGLAAVKRIIYARALKGRIERGGAGLTGTEREMISGMRGAYRADNLIRGAKGAAILAALGGAGYGVKKLLESRKKD